MPENPSNPRLLLIAHDVLGRQMAGPGIRYFHFARILSRHFELRFLHQPCASEADENWLSEQLRGVRRELWMPGKAAPIDEAMHWAAVAIFPPDLLLTHSFLREAPLVRVIDGYDPLLIEYISMLPEDKPEEARRNWEARWRQLQLPVATGDFFLCASERQRDWWIGLLEAGGRLCPETVHADHSLRNLVDVVPYGLPETPPPRPAGILQGLFPEMPHDARVLLWGGGLWRWLDPMCALAALRLIRAHEPRAVLVFPGTVHPNPKIGEAASLAREIRETVATDPELRANVFFHGWVDYEDWGSILAESAVALSLHHDSLETRLAFRSRVLEYIWAGLPVVATGGDVLAEIISRRDLGQVVPAGAPEAVARAVLSLLREPVERRSEAFAAARGELIWEKNLRPLIRFCENPRPAADRAGGQVMPPPAETIQSLRARISALEADKQGDERGVTAPGGKEAKRKPGRWWRGIFGG